MTKNDDQALHELKPLHGRVAIVTGASSGIGRATVLELARAGANLVVSARRQTELDELVGHIEGAGLARAVSVTGDLADATLAEELVRVATEEFGGLDMAFNNGGTLGAMGETPNILLEAFDETIAVNLRSAFAAARQQIPAMLTRGKGSIVFTSTFVGYTVGFAGMAAYATSKSGLIGLTQALAAEVGGRGIRVNALLPGGTDTAMGRAVASTPEARAHVESLHALGRIADPEEVARAAAFLLSDASSFVTGTAFLVDGGVSIHRG